MALIFLTLSTSCSFLSQQRIFECFCALTRSNPLVLQEHQGCCPQESVYCENKCGARMMRRVLSQHSLSECPKRTQPCPYCSKEFVFDTIQVINSMVAYNGEVNMMQREGVGRLKTTMKTAMLWANQNLPYQFFISQQHDLGIGQNASCGGDIADP